MRPADSRAHLVELPRLGLWRRAADLRAHLVELFRAGAALAPEAFA